MIGIDAIVVGVIIDAEEVEVDVGANVAAAKNKHLNNLNKKK